MFRSIITSLRTNTSVALLVLAFGFSMATNALLVKAARHLSSDYEEYRTKIQGRPRAGDLLPALVGRDSEQHPLRVGFEQAAHYTLVLAYSPYCPYCEKNWPIWARVIASTAKARLRVVAFDITSEADNAFIRTKLPHDGPRDLTLFGMLDYPTTAAYNVHVVPTTILIRPDGTLQQSWTGILDAGAIQALEAIGQPTSSEPRATPMP